MEHLDLNYICTVIGNLAGIPIRLYRGDELSFYHALIRLPRDPMEIYRDELWQVQGNVGYFVTPQFHYYGIVNSGEIKIVIGPTSQIVSSDQELRELAFRADVVPEETDDFVSGIKSIVRMPLESIMQILCTINYILNGEKLGLEDIAIYDSRQSALNELMQRQLTEQVYSHPQADQQQAVHNTLELEKTIMSIVQKGDTAALRDWISAAPPVRGGVLAASQLRQLKNTLIVSTTLASRAAIRGGMAAEDALSLSDAFIQKCELLSTADQIGSLQYHMILEFTQRVEQLRLGRQPTRLALDVTNYVRHHLSEPIRAEDIAKELFISRPYLSSKFHEDTGKTLTDFILGEKTEEAKRLLRYTDKTITAISSYLGFSSQGHFTRVFKKYVGKTPAEYREQHGKIEFHC